MPPSMWHAVYTATPSFTSGGHFLTYETLHLTEFSRDFDSHHSECSTNANHQINRILCRMTLALPIIAARRCQSTRFPAHVCHRHTLLLVLALFRRATLALARMILDPRRYRPQSKKNGPDIRLSGWDLLQREEHHELQAAQTIVRDMLRFADIKEEQLASMVESTGSTWFECGDTMELPWPVVS